MPGKPFPASDDVADRRDGGLEAWLRDVVVPTAEEMKAHPERALGIEDVRQSLDRHHERRKQVR